ncbi:glycine cleavage system aminomethyltransferase GcvT [Microbacterium stercoris]|uniref:Aminomethyltransferase n=1 Tax=Microbacterium stercoris TaxID=2820289 RepID=A0A939QPI9_9MICO|nr:glycine cleavage system aminomethyltransferase GcvT [Microbacterium stercoris]MBO3662291.1 glycine cleavage system protein T [Microbacterium stercoris]
MAPQRTTPLHSEHTALGASFTDFGGWLMPVRYSSDLAEHHAVRQAAGLFDISHMGEIVVDGPQSAAFLDFALAGAISRIPVGRAKYTMILAEDGGIIDDLIVYRTGEHRFLIVANAGNRETVVEELRARISSFAFRRTAETTTGGTFAYVVGDTGVELEDVSDQFALLALQGPAAERILGETPGVVHLSQPLAALRAYAWASATFQGEPLVIARTGYTGEDGFELLVPARHAVSLWRALLEAGEPHQLVPAGLAARDTLRLEAGMPLYGHELSRGIRPEQAGLGRVIPAGKRDFVGEHMADPDAPVLIGLSADGRRAGRAGYGVFRGDDRVGEITSGALSPTLGHPVAMAYVRPDAAEAPDLTIDIRGTRVPASVTALPFYRRIS